MMTIKQFAAWKKIADEDIEFADEVLRYMTPISTPEEAIADLISDSELPEIGIANHPKFGRADEVAKRIAEEA